MARSIHQPLFGSHGRKVVAFLCGWELLALTPGSPMPTLTETVRRYPLSGFLLLGMLAHHWYLEAEAALEVLDVLEAEATFS